MLPCLSPLSGYIALVQGYADIARCLLDNGANVNVRHKFAGSTSLHFAVEMCQVAKVPRATTLPLLSCTRPGITCPILPPLLALASASLSFPDMCLHDYPLSPDWCLLQLDMISLLCERGIDVEATKTNGGRALHVAADSNQSEAAGVLLRVCYQRATAIFVPCHALSRLVTPCHTLSYIVSDRIT